MRTARAEVELSDMIFEASNGVACIKNLPQLTLGEAVATRIRAVDQKGNVKWQEQAKIMLVKGRPADTQRSLTSASP